MRAVLSFLFSSRHLPDFIALSMVGLLQTVFVAARMRGAGRRARTVLVVGWALSASVLAFGFLLRFARVATRFPPWFSGWGRGLVMLWGFFSVLTMAVYAVSY